MIMIPKFPEEVLVVCLFLRLRCKNKLTTQVGSVLDLKNKDTTQVGSVLVQLVLTSQKQAHYTSWLCACVQHQHTPACTMAC